MDCDVFLPEIVALATVHLKLYDHFIANNGLNQIIGTTDKVAQTEEESNHLMLSSLLLLSLFYTFEFFPLEVTHSHHEEKRHVVQNSKIYSSTKTIN